MKRAARLAAASALLILVAHGIAAAQEASFGLGQQLIHLGPPSFRPAVPSLGFFEDTNGYLYGNPGAPMVWVAPVSLPEGAELTQVCLYARDTDPSQTISVHLDQFRLVDVGPFIQHDVIPAVSSDFDDGAGVACSGPLSYSWRESRDVNGDGSVDSAPHRLVVYAQGGSGLGLGGVRLRFRRRISPAPASPTFGDVPTSHPYFQVVEALAKSGITAGCGGDNYCPDQPITRGQMAVFLAKALGLQWP